MIVLIFFFPNKEIEKKDKYNTKGELSEQVNDQLAIVEVCFIFVFWIKNRFAYQISSLVKILSNMPYIIRQSGCYYLQKVQDNVFCLNIENGWKTVYNQQKI